MSKRKNERVYEWKNEYAIISQSLALYFM